MLYLLSCLCLVFTQIDRGFGCPKFQYLWSQYTGSILGNETRTWLDVKEICDLSAHLASLTTSDELVAVLDYLQMNWPDGRYAIGLSRQAGLNKSVAANWKWETGEAFDSSIPWSESGSEMQPNKDDSVPCGVMIRISTREIFDVAFSRGMNGDKKGYICECNSLYFQSMERREDYGGSSEVGMIHMNVLYMRCALQCLRRNECHGFHVDDAGCHIEEELHEGNFTRHYAKIIYCKG